MNTISLFPLFSQIPDASVPSAGTGDASSSPFAALLELLGVSNAPAEEKDALLELLDGREEDDTLLGLDLPSQLEPLMAGLLAPPVVREPASETVAESFPTVPGLPLSTDEGISHAQPQTEEIARRSLPPLHVETDEPAPTAHAFRVEAAEISGSRKPPVETEAPYRNTDPTAASSSPATTQTAVVTEPAKRPSSEPVRTVSPPTVVDSPTVRIVSSTQTSNEGQSQMLFQGKQNRVAILSGNRFQGQSEELSALRTPEEVPFAQELRTASLPTANTTPPPEEQLRTSILERLSVVSEPQPPLADGESKEFTVSLRPDTLGEIKIRMVMESGRVSIALIADNEVTRTMLQSRADALTESLRAQEVELHSLTVHTQQQDTGSSFQGSHSHFSEQAKQAAKLAVFPLTTLEQPPSEPPRRASGVLNLYA